VCKLGNICEVWSEKRGLSRILDFSTKFRWERDHKKHFLRPTAPFQPSRAKIGWEVGSVKPYSNEKGMNGTILRIFQYKLNVDGGQIIRQKLQTSTLIVLESSRSGAQRDSARLNPCRVSARILSSVYVKIPHQHACCMRIENAMISRMKACTSDAENSSRRHSVVYRRKYSLVEQFADVILMNTSKINKTVPTSEARRA
jgi:hypothetical protein